MLIENKKRAKQLLAFDGLQYGSLYPTDIDALIEYKNKAYVIIEVKHGSKEVPCGQRVALERMADDFGYAGKPTLVIVCEHDIDDCDKSVDVSKCYVRETLNSDNMRWNKMYGFLTVKESIDAFTMYIDMNY